MSVSLEGVDSHSMLRLLLLLSLLRLHQQLLCQLQLQLQLQHYLPSRRSVWCRCWR